MKIYLLGSLRNPRVPVVASELRREGFDVFDDWYAAGRDTDEHWQAYEMSRGRTFREALEGHHANTVFALDTKHLIEADAGVLVAPAGKSAHLELGYCAGMGKVNVALFEREPERWDVMMKFTNVVSSLEELKAFLKEKLCV